VILLLTAVLALTPEEQIDRLTAHCDNGDLNVVYACIQEEHDKLETRIRSLFAQQIEQAKKEDRADYEERHAYDPTYALRNDGEAAAKEVEDAWLAWRDTQCRYETYDLFRDHASVAPSTRNHCSMRLMLQRMDELTVELKRGAK
jgi:uncharacterized protein YecT (DUF1311 family)